MSNGEDRLARLSPEKRALLELRLAQAVRTNGGLGTIPRRPSGVLCPLSFSQQRLWLLHQMEQGSPAYHICRLLRLRGKLDAKALDWALNAIIARHESIRTVFRAVGGQPHQVVIENARLNLSDTDLTRLPEEQREAEALAVLHRAASQPFDLENDAMLRAALVRLDDEEHLLLLVMHHISSDGWSMGILLRELGELYGTRVDGLSPSLPELPIQYADFSIWQRESLRGQRLDSLLDYWQKKLATDAHLLGLPTDRPRPPAQSHRGARLSMLLPEDLREKMSALARRQDVTMYMLLLASLQTLLFRYSGQENISVGSPMAGRTRTETEGLVGFFVNTLVMRTNLSGDPTFVELLAKVREVCLGAYAHQEIPFERLVEEINPPRDPSYNPLFQVMLAYQNLPTQLIRLQDIEITTVPFQQPTSMFDLTLFVHERSDSMEAVLEYSTDLFDRLSAERLLRSFRTLIEKALESPTTPISLLPLMAETELRQLVVDWNNTGGDYPRDRCIHQLYEEQASRSPNAVAIISGPTSISFNELDKRANQLAHYLIRLGVRPGATVGIYAHRSPDTVIAMLAIMKTGAAYLPLAADQPPDRLAFMICDSRIPVLVTTTELASRLPQGDAAQVCLDTDQSAIAQMPEDGPAIETTPERAAFVVYTSGSTGRPKGVLGLHRGMVNRFAWMWNLFPFSRGEVGCHKSSISFVDSIWELFGPLLQGVPVAVIKEGIAAAPSTLVDTMAAHRVSRIVLVPSLLREIMDAEPQLAHRLPSLSIVTSSGEPLPMATARRFLAELPGVRLLNLYGTSEVSADVTMFDVATLPPDALTVPIGRPMANNRVYILDRRDEVVPVGVWGELCVAGDGLAAGYVNDPELTARRFVSLSLPLAGTDRIYRTGDIARYLPGGDVELKGRIDHQVKIRGIRVEMGDVECALTQHPSVESAVVVASGEGGNRKLAAYLTSRDGARPEAGDLRGFLRTRLPEYMMPSSFAFLDALPTTPSGKVDRARLAFMTGSATVAPAVGRLPRSGLELQLAAIWEEALGIGQVGVTDHFFDIGGHSLLAFRLVAAIEKRFGQRLPLSSLFESGTIEAQATLLEANRCSESWPCLVPIQPRGTLPPLFCIHGRDGEVLHYRELASHLGPDQPLWGIQALGKPEGCGYHYVVEEMASRYIAEIKSVQPEGPYRLGGYSAGGVWAFEMARQLNARGEPVALLALFDTRRPNYHPRLPLRHRLRHRVSTLATLSWGARADYLLQIVPIPDRMRDHARNLRSLNSNDRTEYIISKAKLGLNRLRSRLGQKAVGSSSEDGQITEREMAIRKALREYSPRCYAGRMTYFQAEQDDFDPELQIDPRSGWKSLASGGLEIHEIPGHHLKLICEPAVTVLAKQLRQCLLDACGAGREC